MAKGICSVEGCERLAIARGWCTKHYQRWKAHGDPCYARPTLAERFWAKVDKRGPDECWPWLASRLPWGYGQIGIQERPARAHRVSYELHFGPIPEGLWVLHTCDNPPCCNPAHLWLGTVVENTADMDAKGRRRVGNAKLTAAQAAEIRAIHGERQRDIAARYGVCQMTVSLIRSGKTWRTIPDQTTP